MRFSRLAKLSLAAVVAAAGLAILPPARAVAPEEVDVPAPELTGGPWLNTPHGSPVRVGGRRGQVTVLHFWTFG